MPILEKKKNIKLITSISIFGTAIDMINKKKSVLSPKFNLIKSIKQKGSRIKETKNI